jgi:hypothetical protein
MYKMMNTVDNCGSFRMHYYQVCACNVLLSRGCTLPLRHIQSPLLPNAIAMWMDIISMFIKQESKTEILLFMQSTNYQELGMTKYICTLCISL